MLKMRKPDVAVFFSVFAFIIDCIINYKLSFPFFVICLPLSTLLFLWATPSLEKRVFFFAVFFSFSLSFSLNLIRFGFQKESLSDYLYLLNIFSVYFFSKTVVVHERTMTYIFILLFTVYTPTFFGINAGGWDADVFISGSVDIEYLRVYNQGLFRLPHIAAYLLLLGGLWWIYAASYFEKKYLYACGLVFIFLSLYTGVRTSFVIIVVGYVVASLRFTVFSVFSILLTVAMVTFFILKIEYLMSITYGSFLFQYVSFFDTFLNNFDRLSRVIIWSSWFSAVSDFNYIDFAFGRSYVESLKYNEINIGLPIWFHNDFLGIFYAYGFIGFIFYCIIMIKMVRSAYKGQSFILKAIGIFIIMSACMNGFYKYMPVLFFVFIGFANGVANKRVLNKKQ